MAAAAAMTLLKLGAGLLSGSLGVLSDAAHSGLDLAGSALTFFSVNVSDKPADEDHTYGHGKIENLSAFAEAGLMAVSCAWIVWEAVERIDLPHRESPPLPLAGAGAAHFDRRGFLALTAVARGGSAHRVAGAGHGRLPLCLGHLGHARGAGRIGRNVAGMRDSGLPPCNTPTRCAAILVSLLILRMAIRLGHEAVGALLDEIPAETRRRLVREVERVEGVLAVERARVRRAGAGYFVDLTLAMPRRFTFEHTGELVNAATAAVHACCLRPTWSSTPSPANRAPKASSIAYAP